jgi:excisionase family DNA binding protein
VSHDVLTVDEVADMLRVGRITIQRLLRVGTLPGAKVGRSWRIHKEGLQKYLDRQDPPPNASFREIVANTRPGPWRKAEHTTAVATSASPAKTG